MTAVSVSPVETVDTSKAAAAMLRQVLSSEERKALLRVNPLRSWWMIASNWVVVFAAMGLVAWAPNPLTVVVALFVIAARQLGMAVVMHEAAHRTLFRHRGLNDWAGNWLGA
jgi:fatty acid desaturase